MPRDKKHPKSEVQEALNDAAEGLLRSFTDMPDEGLRDAVNLMVNLTVEALSIGGEPDVLEVIASNYERDEDGRGPLEWIADALA